jgi:hypothetical protein
MPPPGTSCRFVKSAGEQPKFRSYRTTTGNMDDWAHLLIAAAALALA